MADHEEVIKGLEIVKRRVGRLNGFGEEAEVIGEAINLLKAQEPAEPIEIIDHTKDVKDYNRTLKWKCGSCRKELVGDDVFCRNCGKKVKWE